jgi:hypothetical protein
MFCLPPSVIFHFYFTRLYQNVFCFTSHAPRSIFVSRFFLVPRDLFLFTCLFVLVLFDYPIIWRTYILERSDTIWHFSVPNYPHVYTLFRPLCISLLPWSVLEYSGIQAL